MSTTSPFAACFPTTTVYETIGDAVVPWRFTSCEEEYAALRQRCGLLDLSGAALIEVAGDGAEELLTDLFTREIEFLSPETSIIGMFLDETGSPLDVGTITRSDDGFVIETSVGRGDASLAHLRAHASDGVTVTDRRGELVLLGFEGPDAWAVAEALLDEPITGLPFQGVRPVTAGGVPVTVSRTGFTGEFGFKLVVPAADAAALWTAAAAHAAPAGHEALEIAMLEVRQPLLHREAGGIIEGGFNWLVDLEKESFLGRDALTGAHAASDGTRPVSFVCDAPVVPPGTPVTIEGRPVGHVVHAVSSPGLDAVCGVARVERDVAASGLVFGLDRTDGPGVLRTVSAPVRVPTSWGALLANQES